MAGLVVLVLHPAVTSLAHGAAGDLDPTFGVGGTVTTAIGADIDGARALVLQPDGKLVAAGFCFIGATFDFCLARYNPDGSLDPTFGVGGTVTTAIGTGFDVALALVLQPDGKLVAAGICFNGATFDFCLARYNPDGSLDPTFGVGGTVTTAIGADIDEALALVLQPDGKLVAAGICFNGATFDFCLARYNPGGSLDPTFGVGGTVTTAIGADIEEALALVLQPDGKLVAAGACFIGATEDFCLARYNPDGSLDPTFGVGGTVTTAIGTGLDAALALVLQPDGKLVAAGECVIGSTFNFCLVRYNPDGSLDPTFGVGGTVTTLIGAGGSAPALVLQPDGKLVAAGQCPIGATDDFCLARYNPDGSLDLTFGGSGTVTTDISANDDRARALVLQPDGKLVAAGFCLIGAANDFCLARYQGNGLLTVQIDIKPGGFPNSINQGSRGTVPVAIFSTATFDARTLDPTTVTLASAQVVLKGNGTLMSSVEDVDADGLLDLVVHVETEALQLSETDTEAVLEGKTSDGTAIRGIDSVRVVP